MSLLRGLVSLLSRIGADPRDPAELRVRKLLLVGIALMVLPAGVLWGSLYWFFGERLAAAMPWGYTLGSLLSLIAFHATRSFRLLRTLQLSLILVTPFLLMIVLGGFVPSSGVILWSLVCPLGAIAFDGVRRASGWFVAYLALLLVSTPLAERFRDTPVLLPDPVVTAFHGMNIGALSLVGFVLLATFARQRETAQQQAESLLLSVLPPEIAERLKADQRRIADYFEHASILFADVVEFTPMSSRLPAADVVGMLDHLFSDFDAAVDRHGLEKIKTIGDCYMVAAGVPTPRSDHATTLARLALEMQDIVARHDRDDGRRIELRIGINSGPVVAGVIGRKRFLYDLWGDTVNTASRMESHGLAGQIQITTETYELLRDDFVCRPRGPVEVKGKGLMETWLLVGERGSAAGEAEAATREAAGARARPAASG
jgi:adenylate cyclase